LIRFHRKKQRAHHNGAWEEKTTPQGFS